MTDERLPSADRLEAAVRLLVDALLETLHEATSPPAAAPDRLMNLREVSAALGNMSRSTIYSQLIQTGRLPSVVISNRRRMVKASALATYIAEQGGPRS